MHAGPETREAILAAGFDPEKLRALDPPPTHDNKKAGDPPSVEERIKQVEEKIVQPLSLDPAQSAKVVAAFRIYFLEREKLKNTSPNSDEPPDREKTEALIKTRDESVGAAIPELKFEKYLQLERSIHPHPPQSNEVEKK